MTGAGGPAGAPDVLEALAQRVVDLLIEMKPPFAQTALIDAAAVSISIPPRGRAAEVSLL